MFHRRGLAISAEQEGLGRTCESLAALPGERRYSAAPFGEVNGRVLILPYTVANSITTFAIMLLNDLLAYMI